MPLDDEILDEAKAARDRLVAAQHDVDQARGDYHHAIRRLHAAGGSLREIGEALGLSHQRVYQVVDEEARPLWRRRRGGRGTLQRFSVPARDVMVAAQAEARALRHDALGAEHLLLALVASDEGTEGGVLKALGIELEAVRAAVRERAGEGDRASPEQLPFRGEAKKALELALRESLRLGHDHIGTEHLLLALIRGSGTAADVLTSLGVDADRVRAEVERRLAA